MLTSESKGSVGFDRSSGRRVSLCTPVFTPCRLHFEALNVSSVSTVHRLACRPMSRLTLNSCKFNSMLSIIETFGFFILAFLC